MCYLMINSIFKCDRNLPSKESQDIHNPVHNLYKELKIYSSGHIKIITWSLNEFKDAVRMRLIKLKISVLDYSVL